MGKKLTAEEIGQHVIDNPNTGFDQCCKCQGIETQRTMQFKDEESNDFDLICDECASEANPCSNCSFDMGSGYENCGAAEDGVCPECGTEEAQPEMKEWNVPIMRIGYGHALIAVSARTEQEAIDLAIDEAGGESFSEKSSDYEAPDGAHEIK